MSTYINPSSMHTESSLSRMAVVDEYRTGAISCNILANLVVWPHANGFDVFCVALRLFHQGCFDTVDGCQQVVPVTRQVRISSNQQTTALAT